MTTPTTPITMNIATKALQLAYRKHCLDDQSIGWDELGECLFNALCELMGDDGFVQWLSTYKEGQPE